jgi:hypothetical protein
MSFATKRGVKGQPFARPAWRGARGKTALVNNMEDALSEAVSTF